MASTCRSIVNPPWTTRARLLAGAHDAAAERMVHRTGAVRFGGDADRADRRPTGAVTPSRVLVVNAGSSSVKLRLIGADD
jgi:hypothetical protein